MLAVAVLVLLAVAGGQACCNITTVALNGAEPCAAADCSFDSASDLAQLSVALAGLECLGADANVTWTCGDQPPVTVAKTGLLDLSACWNHTTLETTATVAPAKFACADATRTVTIAQDNVPLLNSMLVSFSPSFSQQVSIQINPKLTTYTVDASTTTAQARVTALWDSCTNCQGANATFTAGLATNQSMTLALGRTPSFIRSYTINFDLVPVELASLQVSFEGAPARSVNVSGNNVVVTTAAAAGNLTLSADEDCALCRVRCAGGQAGDINSTTQSLVYPYEAAEPGSWDNLSVSVYLFGSLDTASKYNLSILRANLSLASLSLTPGILLPALSPGVTQYTAFSPQPSATLSATAGYPAARLNMSGATAASQKLALSTTAVTNVTIQVFLAEEPELAQAYVVQARAVSLQLSALASLVAETALAPPFDPAVFSYTVKLVGDAASGSVQATRPADPMVDFLCNGVLTPGASCVLSGPANTVFKFAVQLRNTSFAAEYDVLIQPSDTKPGASTSKAVIIGASAGAGALAVVVLVLLVVWRLRTSHRRSYLSMPESYEISAAPRRRVDPYEEGYVADPFVDDGSAVTGLKSTPRPSKESTRF